MKLPRPHRLNGCTRWRLSDLEKAETQMRGEPEPPTRSAEDERYLSVKQVAAVMLYRYRPFGAGANPKGKWQCDMNTHKVVKLRNSLFFTLDSKRNIKEPISNPGISLNEPIVETAG